MLFLGSTVGAAIMLYLAFAFFFNTDTERKLIRENRMYAELLPRIQEGEERRADEVAYLQHRDSVIYNLVFHSGAPDPALLLNETFYDALIDTMSYAEVITRNSRECRAILATAGRVDSLMMDVNRFLSSSTSLPPMSLPVRGITYPQVGAGAGNKINPFLKASVKHDGLDFVLERGDTVYANADGTVVIPSRIKRSDGIVLEIKHRGGYVTRMEHLEGILVEDGDRVIAGDAVATVGMTGNSSAPHLHYGIRYDGRYQDPIDFIFASVAPAEYVNMLFMSSKTIQSLD